MSEMRVKELGYRLMHNLDSCAEKVNLCAKKVKNLQEVIKIYLMATNGSTERLGGITCCLVDILTDLCGGLYARASKQLDTVSIELVKVIYTSVIERLEGLGDSGAATHKKAQRRVESEIELLPYLLFLKSVLVDLSIATKTDHTPISQKLQELINGLGS